MRLVEFERISGRSVWVNPEMVRAVNDYEDKCEGVRIWFSETDGETVLGELGEVVAWLGGELRPLPRAVDETVAEQARMMGADDDHGIKPWDNPAWWSTLQTPQHFNLALAQMVRLQADATVRERLVELSTGVGVHFVEGIFIPAQTPPPAEVSYD